MRVEYVNASGGLVMGTERDLIYIRIATRWTTIEDRETNTYL